MNRSRFGSSIRNLYDTEVVVEPTVEKITTVVTPHTSSTQIELVLESLNVMKTVSENLTALLSSSPTLIDVKENPVVKEHLTDPTVVQLASVDVSTESLDPNVSVSTEAFDESDYEAYEVDEIEGGNDADVIEDAIDQILDVATGLEEIKYQLEESLANGGLDKQSAVFADLAISYTCRPWVRRVGETPSLESFGDGESRMTATGYTLESVKDVIEATWKRIVEFVKKWLIAITSFVAKFDIETNLLEQRALFQIKKANKATVVHNNAAFKVPNEVSSKLYYENMSSPKLVSNGLKSYEDLLRLVKDNTCGYAVAEKFLTILDKVDLSSKEKAKEFYADIKKADVTLNHMIDVFKKSVSTIWFTASNHPLTKHLVDSDTTKYLVLGSGLLGHVSIVAKFTGHANGLFKSLDISIHHGLDSNDRDDLKLLNVNEIMEVSKAVADLAKEIRESKVAAPKVKDLVDKIMKSGERANREILAGSGLEVEPDELAQAKSLVTATAKIAIASFEPSLSIQKVAMETAKAAYTYGFLSLKHITEKEGKKED